MFIVQMNLGLTIIDQGGLDRMNPEPMILGKMNFGPVSSCQENSGQMISEEMNLVQTPDFNRMTLGYQLLNKTPGVVSFAPQGAPLSRVTSQTS